VRLLNKEAPALTLAAPQLDLLDDKTSKGIRSLRLRATSPRHAPQISIYVPDTEVISASVNGKRMEPKVENARKNLPNGWMVDYSNLTESGIEIALEVKTTEPLKIRVVDRSRGIPEIPGASFKPKPDYIMSVGSGDVTMVSKLFTF